MNSENKLDHLLVFGLGYAASAIADTVKSHFGKISVTNRNANEACDPSFNDLIFDGENVSDGVRDAIQSASHILVSIGPNADGDPVLNSAQALIEKSSHLKWLGYLSTVGVYGNHDGEWVDEETICRPVSARSIQRLDAEQNWQGLANRAELPLTIFRLSGIFGPGRNALVNADKGRSRRLVKKGQVFNRIHRDDIARMMAPAILRNCSGIFNVTDDEPAPPQDVVTYVHRLRGSEPPPEIDFETADITPMARSFYGENKRVSNAKSKLEFGIDYRWPNYRIAFDAMWREGNWR